MADNNNNAGAKKAQGPAAGTDPTKCPFIIKGPTKNRAISSADNNNNASAKKAQGPAAGTDPTKCPFIIKGSTKNSALSSFEYDRSTAGTPGSEHLKPTTMPGSDQDKEKATGGTTADETQPEKFKHAGTQIGAEDTTIIERRLARTLGTDPVPRSQSSMDRMLELQDTWSSQIPRNPDNLVAFRGTKNDVWTAQLPARTRSRSVGSEAENTSDSPGTTAAAPAPAPAPKEQDNSNSPGTTATAPAPAPKEQDDNNAN